MRATPPRGRRTASPGRRRGCSKSRRSRRGSSTRKSRSGARRRSCAAQGNAGSVRTRLTSSRSGDEPMEVHMRKLSQRALEVLGSMDIEGDLARITAGQLPRELYLEVNKALEALGGAWHRKRKGHVFP